MISMLLLLACADSVGTTDTATADTGTTSDSGTTGGTDSGPAATHVLITTTDGLELRDLDGGLESLWAWGNLSAYCLQSCNPQGVQADGDGVLVVYSVSNQNGGILRLKPENGDLVVDWELSGYSFPHDAVTDPSGLGVIVAETFASQVLWLDPSDESLYHTLDDSNPDYDYALPNALDLIQEDGRSYLLMSNRGNDKSGGGTTAVDGTLVLWDITEPTTPTLTWAYPESGTVGMPHSPVLRKIAGNWVLAYAHTIGVAQDGDTGKSSVGLATTSDLSVRLTYLADGILPTALGDIATSRGVELSRDGRLYVVETASRGGVGRLITATLPDLEAPELTGAYTVDHANQTYVELTDAEVLVDDLKPAFEPRLWTPTY